MTKTVIRAIVLLVGTYVMAQAIADIGATKLVQIGGVVMPGGTFIFALTFTLRDMIHKRLGKEWAKMAIYTAAGLNVLLAVYMLFIARLPSPEFFWLADSWNAIFAIVPAITIGSIAAELVSELTDTEVYHFWKTRFPNAPQWSRVLASNFVSLPVDSIVFTALAFVLLPPVFGAESMPLAQAITQIASGQILYKAVVTILSLPLIYTIKDKPIDPNWQLAD
jgi:uncharacterized integral membrane protein (TIGR00697 family)